MNIMNIGAQLLASKLGGSANADQLSGLLGGLLGNSDDGGVDFGSLIGNLQANGLGDTVQSWLGDGENAEISEDQLQNVFGAEKIQEMASQLNTDEGSILSGLKDAIPQMVDQSSSGGNLLDSVGGVSGLAGIASKFLK